MPETSLFRLYLLRAMYLLNFVLLGAGVAFQFMTRERLWDPMTGVAFSFWAALAVLSALGLRYPLALLPVLFVQLLYKTFWLMMVYLPLRAVGRSSSLLVPFVITAIVDIIVIPWPYVFAQYFKKSGDRWTAR